MTEIQSYYLEISSEIEFFYQEKNSLLDDLQIWNLKASLTFSQFLPAVAESFSGPCWVAG